MKIDSSALIYLAKIDLLDVFAKCYFPLNITATIYQEVVMNGKTKGYSDAYIIDNYISKGKLIIKPDDLNYPENLSSLSKGEVTAIAEVIATQEMLILDDKKARSKSKEFNLNVLGSDTLILDAFLSNYITYDVFQTKLQQLANIMLLKSEKVNEILKVAQKFNKNVNGEKIV